MSQYENMHPPCFDKSHSYYACAQLCPAHMCIYMHVCVAAIFCSSNYCSLLVRLSLCKYSMEPVGVLKAFEKHILSETRVGLTTLAEAATEAMPNVIARLRQLKDVPMEQVTDANEHLASDSAIWTSPQRRELGKLIKTLMNNPMQAHDKSLSTVMQNNKYVHQYFPAKVWAVAESKDILKNKFRFAATFLITNLGIRHPDEATKKRVVVCVLMASKLDPEPNEAYEYVREFSTIFEQKRASISSAQTLANFPKDPSEFMTLFPSAYGEDDPPVNCRLDEQTILERCRPDITPLRSSNIRVKRSSTDLSIVPTTRHHPQPQDQVNTTLLGLLQHYMHKGSPESPPPDLSSNRKPVCARPRSPLAIEDREDSSSHMDEATHPSISGGVASHITPPALIPPNTTRADKLRELSADISTSCAEARARAEGKRKKRSAANAKEDEDDEDEDEEEEEEEDDAPSASKKAAAALKKKPAAARKTTAANKKAAKKKAAKEKSMIAIYAKLSKARPKTRRPKASTTSCRHYGGSILWQGATKSFRVFKKLGDKKEERLRADPADKTDVKFKFGVACAMIESDPRNN